MIITIVYMTIDLFIAMLIDISLYFIFQCIYKPRLTIISMSSDS